MHQNNHYFSLCYYYELW